LSDGLNLLVIIGLLVIFKCGMNIVLSVSGRDLKVEGIGYHARMRRITLIFCATVLLVGCAALSKGAWVQDTLYFGLTRPGGTVSEEEWQGFVDAEVTPRFPDGMTQIPATGQWKAKDGSVTKEGTKVLVLLHTRDKASDDAVQALRQAYKNRFQQESVLRVTQLVNADF
jgi:hypothetical protein